MVKTVNADSIIKRLQWSIGANPRIKPVKQAVLMASEDRKGLLSENAEMSKRVERLMEGVICFESLRLPGFESNKFDSELIKMLEHANKVG